MDILSAIVAVIAALALFGLMVLFGWMAVESGRASFNVTNNVEGADKHWTRFAGVYAGLTFMPAAIAAGIAGFAALGAAGVAVFASDGGGSKRSSSY